MYINYNPTEYNMKPIVHYVYYIECFGFYKIGVSRNPLKTLRMIQKANPMKLSLVMVIPFKNRYDAISQRSLIHEAFKEKHNRNFWFRLDIDDVLDCFNGHKYYKPYFLNLKIK